MKQFIVITTINPINPETNAFLSSGTWKVIIIGDKKSSVIGETENLKYYSIEKQELTGFNIHQKLPYNHYARKNLGYLLAMRENASIIYETDDDNEPLAQFSWPEFYCEDRINSEHKFLNIFTYFSKDHSWPRGFPLEYITNPKTIEITVRKIKGEIGVWQGMVSGDPDVDAIYRLTNPVNPEFGLRPTVYLHHDNYCPFNSQNTFWSPRAFPLMYLPVFVNPRFSDILRGYIAQRLMKDYHLHLGFLAPNVSQKRNPHDLMKDFIDEWELYHYTSRIIELLDKTNTGNNILQGLRNIYEVLCENGIIPGGELEVVDLWCRDYLDLIH